MADFAKPEDAPRIVGWSVVYLLNLIVPGFFGSIICRDGGLVGMFLGIIVFYAVTTFFVVRFQRFGRIATSGGLLFAVSQLWPVLQMLSGTFALQVWDVARGQSGQTLGTGFLAEVGGFMVTIMTGQPLFALALVLGLLIETVRRMNRDPVPEPVREDD